MLAIAWNKIENTHMPEQYGPPTKEFYIHETYELAGVEDSLVEFAEKGAPIVLWQELIMGDSEHIRNISLTKAEREQIMIRILGMCGVPEDFHPHIKLLKNSSSIDNKIWADETTFGEQRPSLIKILNWLVEDFSDAWDEEPNNFTVGLVIDAPKGLVVIKHKSEEIDDDDYEFEYQIAMYPKDKIDDIYWYIDKYHSRP
jgi:hypothetical protein